MVTNRFAAALGLANLCLLILIVAQNRGPLAAPAVEPVVRAESIELVDRNGVLRAQLGTETNSAVVLRLTDQDGTIRVKLGADRLGSGLLLADERAEVGVHLLAGISLITGERSTMITVADPGGVSRVIRPAGIEAGP